MLSPRYVPRLATVIATVTALLVALPIGGIAWLRLFENELIRRTESELYAQGAFVTAQFAEAWKRADVVPVSSGYGRPVAEAHRAFHEQADGLRPIPARLDRGRTQILPPAPDAVPAGAAEPRAEATGAVLQPILEEARRITLAGIRVVDAGGVEVANTRGQQGVSLLGWSEVPRALDGEIVATLRARISDEPTPTLTSKSRRTRVRVFVAMPVVVDDRVVGAVVLSRTPVSLARAAYEYRGALAVTALGLLALAGLLAWWLSVTIRRPLVALRDAAASVVAGQEGASAVQVHRPGTREVAELTASVQSMAETLERRADAIGALATAISHELKTPIAALRGAAELLEDHGDELPAAERAELVGVVAREGERLQRLVQQLIELARADVQRPAGWPSVWTEEIGRAARAAGVTEDELDVPAGTWRTTLTPDALHAVLLCLVQNARTYGGPSLRVRALPPASGDQLGCLEVADDGDGPSDANLERLFEPFFTTGRAHGGTGVGLAIVQRLARAHGGDATVQRRDGWTVFRVCVPLCADADGAAAPERAGVHDG